MEAGRMFFGAQNEVVYVGSRGEPGHLAAALDGARGRHQPHVHHQVLDVAVDVLLHARRPRGHPAAQRAELVRVRLVPRAHTVLRQLFLQVLANDAGLDVGRHVHLVHPQDAVHLGRVQGHNHPRLPGRTLQGTRYAGTAAKWYDDNVVTGGRQHKGDDVLVTCRPHHQVGNARKGALAQYEDLPHGVTMSSEEPVLAINRVGNACPLDVIQEWLVDGGHWKLLVRRRLLCRDEHTKVHTQGRLHPRLEVRQRLVANLVPVPGEGNVVRGAVDHKLGVLVAPAVPLQEVLPPPGDGRGSGDLHVKADALFGAALGACLVGFVASGSLEVLSDGIQSLLRRHRTRLER